MRPTGRPLQVNTIAAGVGDLASRRFGHHHHFCLCHTDLHVQCGTIVDQLHQLEPANVEGCQETDVISKHKICELQVPDRNLCLG